MTATDPMVYIGPTSIARTLRIGRVRLNQMINAGRFLRPDIIIGIMRPHARGRGWDPNRITGLVTTGITGETGDTPVRYLSVADLPDVLADAGEPLSAIAIRKQMERGAFPDPTVQIEGERWSVPGWDPRVIADHADQQYGYDAGQRMRALAGHLVSV